MRKFHLGTPFLSISKLILQQLPHGSSGDGRHIDVVVFTLAYLKIIPEQS
ncbi:hypothetical protein ABES03_14240 [Neobacillus rhizosphaerae]